MVKELDSMNLKWNKIEESLPISGTYVEVRLIYTDNNLKTEYNYTDAFFISYYICLFYLLNPIKQTGMFVVELPYKTKEEKIARSKLKNFDEYGNYILYNSDIEQPNDSLYKNLEWRYITEQDGKKSIYTHAI